MNNRKEMILLEKFTATSAFHVEKGAK